ncbi:MAG: CvpA family protein [Clostridiales bacterium]|nr:CvpA family protein [Clostridiales bacterium]
MTGVIIDVALIVIVIICAFRGFRNGMIRGLFGFLVIVLSLVLANAAASAFSDEFTDALRPFVGGIVDGQVQDILSPEGSKTDRGEDGKKAPVVYEYDSSTTHGMVMNTLKGLGFLDSVAESIAESIGGETRETGYALSDIIGTKLSSALAHIAVFAIAFLLLSIVFAILGNLLNVVFSLPGLRLVDQIVGTVLGLFKGIVIVMFFALVFRYLGLAGIDISDETSVLLYFAEHNVIANLLGI